MLITNQLRPNKDQMKLFMEFPDDSPIKMVNLLKFKDKASYDDGRTTDLSGQEAYAIYASEVIKHLEKVGAEVIFTSKVKGLLIGDAENLWDMVIIAKYPNKTAMIKMIMDSDYLESEKHRSAGLEGQLNIITQDE